MGERFYCADCGCEARENYGTERLPQCYACWLFDRDGAGREDDWDADRDAQHPGHLGPAIDFPSWLYGD
jgi:hypothetical protein